MLFIKKNENLLEVQETTYDKEDQMQEYIYENPQILPVEELTGNKKLIVLIRELSTNYGRLDGLGIDEAGNIYIIETKLLRNPDRRNIIAQLLDYGVALWTEYKDPQSLLDLLASKNINIKQLILDKFKTSEELADIIIDNFKSNLKQGVYQFVAVTDAIENRILEQIHFINQSSKFSFFLVDLRYYRHENDEFIIPKGFGGEIIKNISSSTGTSVRQSDLPEFLEAVELNLGFTTKEFYSEFAQLLQSKGYSVEVRVGKKPTMLFFNDKDEFYLFSIYSDMGEIWLNKKSRLSKFDRIGFFNQLFDYKVDPKSSQNQFKLAYKDYENKFQNLLENIKKLTVNKN
ncbi:MAG: hypothetical protein WC872_02795 [Candidatus Absconditabacterales bacterium]